MRRAVTWIFLILVALALAVGLSWVTSMPDARQRGVWQHEANGQILHLTRLQATLYHQTSQTCVETMVFPAHLALVKALEGAWIEGGGDTLDLVIDGNLAPYRFNRIPEVPATCTAEPDTSPHAVFMAMWTMMDEHYAFFDLHGVDWASRRALAPAPDEAMSDTELYARFQQALAGLDDGHIQLGAPGQGFFTPSQPPDWMPRDPISRTELNTIARNAIGTPLTAIERTGLEIGLRDDGIGYVLITGMFTDPGFNQLGTDLARAAFEEVSAALASARALIIDVRYNPGGDDGTAFAYASHLTDVPLPVLTKRTRMGTGWTSPIEAVVTPADPAHRIDVPVVLLTSRLTGSGAEIFTMALREMPQVTVMGEQTGGGLSDILGTTLPNGWLFGLSDQEYRTPDGSLFEGSGLPPDILVETDAAALLRGEDPVLAAAIEEARALAN